MKIRHTLSFGNIFDKICFSLNSMNFKNDWRFVYRMGDHVSGTSIVKSSGQPISKIIAENNGLIGGMSSFPFLFKVLSVTKPLSIQIHPNKVHYSKSFHISVCFN